MVFESGNWVFEVDIFDVLMMDFFIEFDNRFCFLYVFYFYLLVFELIFLIVGLLSLVSKNSLFKLSSNMGGKGNDGKMGVSSGNGKVGLMEWCVYLVYIESINIYVLGSDFIYSDLIDVFVVFEKIDRVGEVDFVIVWCGWWVLIYGVF